MQIERQVEFRMRVNALRRRMDLCVFYEMDLVDRIALERIRYGRVALALQRQLVVSAQLAYRNMLIAVVTRR